MTHQETFISRLRHQRERLGASLEDIARETRIKPEQIEAFERGDLTAWPRGLYARSWVQGYAAAIGLNPAETVDEFCRLFPEGDRRVANTLREIANIVAQPSAYQDEFDSTIHGDRRESLAQAAPVERAPTSWDLMLRFVRGLRPARHARPRPARTTNF